jgi:sirohydrochlorin ferrochelatase
MPSSAAAAAVGILLLAHGGKPSWNKEIEKVRDAVSAAAPTEIALGMADPKTIQAALDKLEKSGVKRVVAVPLFVNSRSEVLEQTLYVLGLKEKPSEVMRLAAQHMPKSHRGHHMFSLERVKTGLPVTMTPALDDHPLVAEILSERARRLSKDPAGETIILVAHGPVDEQAMAFWNRSLASLAGRISGFKNVTHATLRDDAPPAVREAAVQELRAKVAAAENVIIVPLLIARGGIEKKIPAALKGLEYRWDGKTLMPHPNIERWVQETALKEKKS